MTFTQTQIDALSAPLERKHVATRNQGNISLSYIEGWHAIAELNRIFGHGGWHQQLNSVQEVQSEFKASGRDKTEKWHVSYIAQVRVKVGEDGPIRDGVGFGQGINKDIGQAHESAIKEAATDAFKRAAMTFGWPLGLALYDKSQAHVTDNARHKMGQAMAAGVSGEDAPREIALKVNGKPVMCDGAKEWLRTLNIHLNDAADEAAAVKVWDDNAAVFEKIEKAAGKKGEEEAIDLCEMCRQSLESKSRVPDFV